MLYVGIEGNQKGGTCFHVGCEDGSVSQHCIEQN